MNRKQFLKRLGIGAVAVVVAPKVIAKVNIPSNYTEGLIPFIRRTNPSQIYSPYDFSRPEVMNKLYEKYGDQSFFQLLENIGFEPSSATNTYKHYE